LAEDVISGDVNQSLQAIAGALIQAVALVSAWGMQHSALSAVALGSTRLSLVARPAGASIAY